MITEKRIRDDCKHLARCGMRSAGWCLKYRHICEECKDCTLIHLQTYNTKVENGIILRRCCICGKYLPLSRFHRQKYKNKDGIVYRYQCRCKFCVSDIKSKEYKQKKLKKEEKQ